MTKEKEDKAFRTFQLSLIKDMPKDEKQKIAGFTIGVVSMITQPEKVAKMGETIARDLLNAFEFTKDEVKKFSQALGDLSNGIYKGAEDVGVPNE